VYSQCCPLSLSRTTTDMRLRALENGTVASKVTARASGWALGAPLKLRLSWSPVWPRYVSLFFFLGGGEGWRRAETKHDVETSDQEKNFKKSPTMFTQKKGGRCGGGNRAPGALGF
jgi:hypothetical protein